MCKERKDSMKKCRVLALVLSALLLLSACGAGAASENAYTETTLSAEEAAAQYHALMSEVLDDPAEDSSDIDGPEYVITANNAVAYISYSGYAAQEEHQDPAYSKQYIPQDMVAESPEEVAYIVWITHDAAEDGAYGLAGMQSGGIKAYRRCVKVTIESRISGEIITEFEFLGGDPPKHMQSGESPCGSYPDEAAVTSWVRAAILDGVKAGREAAHERIVGMTERHSFSRSNCIEFLTESRDATLPDAQYAAEHCGVDWMVQAERCAYENRRTCRTREEMITMLESYGFTPEEAAHGADSRHLK